MKPINPELEQALAELEAAQNSDWPADLEIAGYKLVCTCPACPEQYDVCDASGKQVGYLRLRHGYFRADAPACGNETVYESRPSGDAMFDDDERLPELTKAVAAIDAWHKKQLLGNV